MKEGNYVVPEMARNGPGLTLGVESVGCEQQLIEKREQMGSGAQLRV